MNKQNKFLIKWQEIRTKGKLFYIIFFWILPISIIFPVVFLLMATYFKFGNEFFINSSYTFKLILGLIISPFIGYTTGSANWMKNENKYEDIIREREKLNQ